MLKPQTAQNTNPLRFSMPNQKLSNTSMLNSNNQALNSSSTGHRHHNLSFSMIQESPRQKQAKNYRIKAIEKNLDLFNMPEEVNDEDPSTYLSAREFFKYKITTQKPTSQNEYTNNNQNLLAAKTMTSLSNENYSIFGSSPHHNFDRAFLSFDKQKRRDRLMIELNSIREQNYRYQGILDSDADVEDDEKSQTRKNNFTSGSSRLQRNTLLNSIVWSQSINQSPRKHLNSSSSPSRPLLMNSSSSLANSPQLSLVKIKAQLTEVKERTQLEKIEKMRMTNMKRREVNNAVAEQRRIQNLKPQFQKFDNVVEKVSNIQHLDKVRRIIAYNTLKQWQKRIKDKKLKRNDLLDNRMRELSKEEEQSNLLMKEYYDKMNQLKGIKESILIVQEKSEEMKEEQFKEEQLLQEKEKEFHMIERIGMLAMLQKYFENKLYSRVKSIHHFHNEFILLKTYFNNIESFSIVDSKQLNEDESKIKNQTTLGKTQFQLNEEKIQRMKKYHQYYQEQWPIIKEVKIRFSLIGSKYLEIRFQASSLQNQYQDLTKQLEGKRKVYDQFKALRDSLRQDKEYLGTFLENTDQDSYNQLLIRQMVNEQQKDHLEYNMKRFTFQHETVVSTITNILQHTSFVMNSMQGKLKLRFPSQINTIVNNYYKSIEPSDSQHIHAASSSIQSGRATPEKTRIYSARISKRVQANQLFIQANEKTISLAKDDANFNQVTQNQFRKCAIDIRVLISGILNEIKALQNNSIMQSFSINEQDIFERDKLSKRKTNKFEQALQRRKLGNNDATKKSQVEKFLLESEKAITQMDDQEEQEFMRNGQQNRMRVIQQKKNESNVGYKLRQEKLSLTMIEQFEKRELDFMSSYITSSNNNINQISSKFPKQFTIKVFKGQLSANKSRSLHKSYMRQGRNSEKKLISNNTFMHNNHQESQLIQADQQQHNLQMTTTQDQITMTNATLMSNSFHIKQNRKLRKTQNYQQQSLYQPMSTTNQYQNYKNMTTASQSYQNSQINSMRRNKSHVKQQHFNLLSKQQFQGYLNKDLITQHNPYKEEPNLLSESLKNNSKNIKKNTIIESGMAVNQGNFSDKIVSSRRRQIMNAYNDDSLRSLQFNK